MSNLCYFEVPVDDIERAKAFYGQLLDWQFEKSTTSLEECDYWHISTGTPNAPGIAFGGLIKRQSPMHRTTHYIHVVSIDEHIEQVQKLGGAILMPKTAVPGKGCFAICLDPDKNAFGLWQCDETG